MQISSQIEFPADPAKVFELLTNDGFLDDVAKASGAQEYTSTVNGNATTSQRTLPAPEMAQKFVGSTITVKDETTWSAAEADGSRTAQVQLTVPGQPVLMNGTIALRPAAGGSTAELSGDLKVNIPLLGKKLEEAAAPAVLRGFQMQQSVAEEWLAR